ncbi:MAG: CotH kinase family protein [Treponema sp.]|nr:CotH kinase family protein [Candidatus Treponema equifaecale]
MEKLERNTNLPLFFIDTEFGKPLKTKEQKTKIRWEYKNKNGSGKIRVRGNSTAQQPKKPYLLILNHKEDFLGTGAAEKWVLISNGTDNTSLRNAYASYLGKNVFTNQRWLPHYEYVNLILNGKFQGVYQLYEKIQIKENRLNLSKGSFLSVTNTRNTKKFNFRTDLRNVGFSLYDPDENQTEEEAKWKIDIINKAEKALFSEEFKNPQTGWRAYFSEDELIDWYWLNEFSTNRDARMKDSCFMFYDSDDKKLHFGPAWDFDIAFGNNSYDENCLTENYWIRKNASWFERLFEDKEFAAKVNNRWKECSPAVKDSFIWLKETKAQIHKAMIYDDRIWKVIGHYQWPHAVGWQKRHSYDDEVQYFYDWLEKRTEWLDNDILSPSTKN